MKNNGDESSDDTFKNEMADAKIESFSEAATPQTTMEDVPKTAMDRAIAAINKLPSDDEYKNRTTESVSNTHLTLPTNRIV